MRKKNGVLFRERRRILDLHLELSSSKYPSPHPIRLSLRDSQKDPGHFLQLSLVTPQGFNSQIDWSSIAQHCQLRDQTISRTQNNHIELSVLFYAKWIPVFNWQELHDHTEQESPTITNAQCSFHFKIDVERLSSHYVHRMSHRLQCK